MKKRIGNYCASCHWYDGYADACGYPKSGCELVERTPPKEARPPKAAKAPEPPDIDADCKGCRYLDQHSRACTYPGFGCVQWKEGDNAP